MSSLIYFFSEALKGFARNLSTALGSIITIFLSLLIIGVFLITAYIADDASEADIQSLQQFIGGLDGVASVSFTTKDEALEKFKNSMTSNPEIVDQLDGQNPLPASVDVELSEAQEVEAIASAIENNEIFRKICDNQTEPADSLKYGQKTVERLFSLTNYIRYIGLALIALLIFIAFVFINNTIRLSILARRKEIAIMRLVGASNNFIRGPFLMEGTLHAIIGAALAILCLQLLRMFAIPHVQSTLQWLPIDISGQSYLLIYGILVIAGLIIGLLGSALAMRRYLKV